MDEWIWLLVIAGIITLTLRNLLARGLSPLNQQAVRQLFAERLLALHPHCQLVEETGAALTVRCDDAACTVYFASLYQQCQEAPHRTMLFVRQAAEAVLQALHDPDRLPDDWAERVMPLLVSEEYPLPPDLARRPLVAPVAIGYALDGDDAFRWLTRAELAAAGVEEDQVHAAALRNLERSCHRLVIEAPPTLPDGRDRLLRFHTADGLDAARVLLPSFYTRFSPRFGDTDVLVAIPSRDLLLAIPATDQAQASFLAWRVESERRRQAHPLTGGLLRVSETGIDVWAPGDAE